MQQGKIVFGGKVLTMVRHLLLTSVTLKNLASLLHLSAEHEGVRRVWQK